MQGHSGPCFSFLHTYPHKEKKSYKYSVLNKIKYIVLCIFWGDYILSEKCDYILLDKVKGCGML
jgi:hypothetical protein